MGKCFSNKAFLFFLIYFLTACLRDPGFPINPVIKNGKLQFLKDNSGGADKIRLTVDFTDGDGDLGLDPSVDTIAPFKPKYVDKPINDTAYIKVDTNIYSYNINVDFLFKNEDGSFKDCNSTPFCAEIIVNESVDAYVNKVNGPDTISLSLKTPMSEILKSYNRIFPKLFVDKIGNETKGPLSGNLRYDIISSQFRTYFSNRTIKLRVSIRDRALHQSNTIETDSLLIK